MMAGIKTGTSRYRPNFVHENAEKWWSLVGEFMFGCCLERPNLVEGLVVRITVVGYLVR